jgi:hypothetical protein
MSLKISISGIRDVREAVKRIADKHPRQVKKVLRSIAERIMTRSKREVPVDLGVLRGTGHVEEHPTRLQVTLIYGGPAAPYAADQHENMSYNHTVGGPKYLSRPLMAEVPGIAQEIARKAPYKP